MQRVIDNVIASYDEEDSNFGRNAHATIAAYFASLPKSKSDIDPQRLGTKSVVYSKIKQGILRKASPVEVTGRETGMKAFNEMDLVEQLRYQAIARLQNSPTWVIKLGIMPDNLRGFEMPEKLLLTDTRAKIDRAKLREDMEVIDGDRLLAKLMPNLTADVKRHHIASAVELATGRRTTEVIMSGKLYLNESQSLHGYKCMFSGQLKAGLQNTGAFEIPLLAPYSAVKAAWDRLRDLYPTDGMDAEGVNSSYAPSIKNYCKSTLGMKPHGLRAAYALMAWQDSGKKMSLIGFIGKVLGHSQPAAASYYQRVKIENYSGPWVMPADAQEQDDEDTHGWKLLGAVELKRLPKLIEMMEQHIPLTMTSIRTHAGASMGVIQRILARNEELIADYNSELEKAKK